MDYREAIAYLYALSPRGMELGLARIESALAARGHPERALPSIIVGGTNGKGSVATMIASVLTAAGHKPGLFTSPHLHRLVERFRIAGEPIDQAELARQVTELRPFLEQESTPRLTFFEVCTLLAFELFRAAGCDVMVLEVGLGGRFDTTNVVTPLASVITSIALDHTDRLGDTLPAIAREKAGIIKPRVPAIVGVREPTSLAAIAAHADQVEAPLYVIERDFSVERHEHGYRFRSARLQLDGLSLPLAGRYQADNLACALAALHLLPPPFCATPEAVARGLAATRWPGRLELLRGAPDVLCDAAHNPHACEALAAHLREHAAHYPRRVLLFGAMRDKDIGQMLAILRPQVEALVFTSAATSRSASAHELARACGEGEPFASAPEALARARELAGPGGLVIACGSIFVMAEIRAEVLGLPADPPIAL